MGKIIKVLIVEDEEIEARALRKFLYETREDIKDIEIVDNGLEALKIINTYLPDVVFMDINMPGINGLECINRINALNIKTNIVITSAYNEFDYAQEAMRLGAIDYLVKPVKTEDINRIFNNLKVNTTVKNETDDKEIKVKQIADIPLLNLREEDKKISKQLLSSVLYGNYEEAIMVLDDYYLYLKNEKDGNLYQRLMWVFISMCNDLPESIVNQMQLEEVMSSSSHKELYEAAKIKIKNICDMLNDHSSTKSKTIAEIMKQIIRTNYDRNISLEILANKMNYSVFYLTKNFKAETNTTFLEYLTAYRIEKAKELLKSDETIIKEISYKVGFNSQSYFSKTFKKYTNMSPIEWANKMKGKNKDE